MSLTPFGLVIAVIGLILMLRSGVAPMLWMTMICALFGGSAAILLPALGGASIPPVQFALAFLVARCILPGSGQHAALSDGLRANVLLGIFTAYGLITAMIASRLFTGAVQVVALRYQFSWSLFATTPLAFSSSNITTSVYLIGTLLLSVGAYVALRDRKHAFKFVNVAVVIVWIHAFFGVSAALLKGTPYDLFVDFVRNANYAQLDQQIGGFVRINGVFPEPSSYAGFGFNWFVLLFECWFRNILPRRTGPAAAAMVLVLIFSTSTTAYASLAIYGFILLIRILILPQSLPARKGIALLAAGIIAVIAIALTSLLVPQVANSLWELLQHLTVGKQDSESGLQRAFWAKIGIDAFIASWGIGVGPGSFRSSTIITAMIGSVGVFGTMVFVLHVIRVIKPLRLTTYFGDPLRAEVVVDQETLIGAAASWGAAAALIPASLIAATCDPGTDFALFGGAALALRAMRRRKTDSVSETVPLADYAHADLRGPRQSSSALDWRG